ncbi:MAG: cupin domain-containing protein [bacterium]|nr:MAG: cupin domain-containing protein [bacterium]
MDRDRIGDLVRKFREIKRLTQEDLAERSGLDREFIVDVETNSVKPAIGSLLRISRAMGIRMANFLDDTIAKDPILVRAADRDEAVRAELSSESGSPASLIFHSLGRGKIDRHMEPFFIEVVPQPPGQVKVSQHEGEEFIAVISGSVELQYGKDTYRLQPGDTVYYSSDVPHRIVAMNDEKAQIYAVIYFNA